MKLDGKGGSEALRKTKALRKGDLSAPSTRFSLLQYHRVADEEGEEAALHGDADVEGEEVAADEEHP